VLKSAAAAEAAAMQAANFPEESFVSPSSSPLRRAGKSHSAVHKRELEKLFGRFGPMASMRTTCWSSMCKALSRSAARCAAA